MFTNPVYQGDSVFIPLDKSLLDKVGINADTELEILIVEHAIVIRPHVVGPQVQNIANAIESTNDRYNAALRRLAE